MISINTPRLRLRALTFAIAAAALLPAAMVNAQTVNTVAGNGSFNFGGDGGPGTSAQLRAFGVAIDPTGNRYIADTFNYRIRKLTPGGVISTVVGTGAYGSTGDGGPATAASIRYVYRMAFDAAGNMYLPAYESHRIRKVTPSGIISTVVGTGVSGYSGDGGPATAAQISGPMAITFDGVGNMYFIDYDRQYVRKVDTAGVITTVAGNGLRGFSGDGGPATAASTRDAFGLGATASGVLYLADLSNHRIRRIGTDGVITTVAGTGVLGSNGDGGPATSAAIAFPHDVKPDASGGFYIADTGGNKIRHVSSTGLMRTFAGTGAQGFSGDGGPAIAATFYRPAGLAISGNTMLLNDYSNARVRQISLFTSCAVSGLTGTKLTLCQKVCETTQPTATLTNLIKLYTAIYREAPPCGL